MCSARIDAPTGPRVLYHQHFTEAEVRQMDGEGWFIFDAEGTWDLQRLDEAMMFADDASARAFVLERHKQGSPLHTKAVEFMVAHSPYRLGVAMVDYVNYRLARRAIVQKTLDAIEELDTKGTA
ncbi:hypothetical protein [Inquilinus sp. OTU3971]|uniref:hypothetical protein n=1 Tax=Inquilinus sp. OTU3971 TaxID=3043855 RepID=UPI00313C8728